MLNIIVTANLVCQASLFTGVVWSIAFPERRVYPFNQRNLLHAMMWVMFAFIFGSNLALVVLDWNTGPWTGGLRFALAAPLAGLGAAFVTWGIRTLGVKNTSALPDGMVQTGPYRISRNPQYVGDLLLFVGVALFANSEMVWVTHLLTALVLLLAPLAEEPWLEEQYGDTYLDYRVAVARYL